MKTPGRQIKILSARWESRFGRLSEDFGKTFGRLSEDSGKLWEDHWKTLGRLWEACRRRASGAGTKFLEVRGERSREIPLDSRIGCVSLPDENLEAEIQIKFGNKNQL
jgi:hypothetical protein